MRHIKERARLVNNTAEEFSLSHAVMALRRIIEEENEAKCSPTLNELKKKIIENPEYKVSDFEKLKKSIFNLDHNRVFIVVDYLDEMQIAGSRTITSDGDYIEIVLPGALKNDVDGLRETLGHELGHLALHLDDLYQHVVKYPFQGTSMIKDPIKEKEANIFAAELVSLRAEHLRETVCKDCKEKRTM